MRFCFVALEIHPTTVGGAGILLKHTACMLLEAGHEIVLLLDISDDDFTRFEAVDKFVYPNPQNIRAYRVSGNRPGFECPENSVDPEYLRSIRISAALSEVLDHEDLDLIEFYDYCGPAFHFFATSRRHACPVVVRLHNTIELIDRKIRNGLTVSRLYHYQMERTQLSLADGILFPGRHYLDSEIKPIYTKLREENCHYSPPVLAPVVSARSAGNDVIFYGRLSTFKGLDTFLAGASIALADPVFSQWLGKFVVIGPEETVASALSLEEMKAVIPVEFRERFKFLGRVEHRDLAVHLDRAAFAVFANRIESFCYAAHELHCAGVPLIVSNTAAFLDHFVDKNTALFFDGTAQGLAEKIRELARDVARRNELSRAGRHRVSSYWKNRYDAHLSAIQRPRVESRSMSITPVIFSDGNAEAENLTLESLQGMTAAPVILRNASHGVLIGGRPFLASDADGRDVSLLLLGQIVLGLRAGDEIVPDWLREATEVMSRSSGIGALSCWERGRQGVQTSADHLLPEHALIGRQGLRRLIRVMPGLTFNELAAQMKTSGEVGLLLAARDRGLAILESPRVGILTDSSVATPTFEASALLKVEYDRIEPGYLAIADAVVREDALFKPLLTSAVASPDLEYVGTKLDTTLCAIRARPDIQPGEVWVRRCFALDSGVQVPWSECVMGSEWRERDILGAIPAMVTTWMGTLAFRAYQSGAIELQTGPFCGAVEVAFEGQTHLLNLRRSKVQSIMCRLTDLAVLGGKIEGVRIGAELSDSIDRHTASFSTRPLDVSKVLLVAERDNWAVTGSMLRSFAMMPPTLRIGDLPEGGVDATRAAAYLLQLANSMSLDKLIIAAESEASIRLIECIVKSARRPPLAILVGPITHGYAGSHGANAMALLVADVFSLIRHRPGGASVVSADTGLLGVFEANGIATGELSLVPPEVDLTGDSVAPPVVAILGCSKVAPTSGHLVAAARLISDQFPGTLICLPATDRQTLKIAETIGARNFRTFENIAELGMLSQSRRSVALAAYPDAMPMSEINFVAKAGFVPVVGPGGLWSAHEHFEQLRVAYWDNPYDICEAAARILTEWQTVRRDFIAGINASRALAEAQARQLLGIHSV